MKQTGRLQNENLQLGIPWIWKPGFSLPPKSHRKAMQSSKNERIEILAGEDPG